MDYIKGRDFSQAEFLFPKSENSLIYTWVWNAPISFDVIDSKLREFRRVGIEGFYILPYPKNYRMQIFVPDTDFEYLSEDFFTLVKYAVDQGKRLGMEVWIYDEGGFPSGGACGRTLSENPKAIETLLYKRHIELQLNERYSASEDAIAAFCRKERVYDGYLASENVIVAEFYTKKNDAITPKRLNSVDSTNKSVIDTFINNTYENYKKHLGDTFHEVGAVFTDEPDVVWRLIPEGFFEKFDESYGYDIKDYLYCIYDKHLAVTEREQLARIHYGRLVGDLFYTNFCQNIADWCSQNGIKFTGHLDVEHIPDGAARQGYFSHLRCLSAFQIPGIDVIWHQIQMPREDQSPVEEGAPFFPRLASSAARQTGKGLAVTESFAVYGDGLTPDEFRYVLNYQAVRGINVFNVMITTAGDKRMQALVQRPVFTAEKPGFYHMEHINAYYKRLSYLLRLGEAQRDTALYIPCADFWANDEISKKASADYIQKGNMLENGHVEFDIIDDYAILSSSVRENGLAVGDALYKNIVVPSCQFMPDEVLEKIKPFMQDNVSAGEKSTLRVMKRKLPSGMLYFIFNEGIRTETVSLPVFSQRRCYQLHAVSGEISELQQGEIKIVCGDIAILYVTERELPAVNNEVEYRVSLKDFLPTRCRRFTVALEGISMKDSPVDTEISDAFSGEITYRVIYELPKQPNPSDRYLFVLEDTAVSARIAVDGKQVATVGFTPMETIVTGEHFQKNGYIEITVANTAANEIVSKADLLKMHAKEVLGPELWHENSLQFEKKAPKIRFGSVKLYKLKDIQR